MASNGLQESERENFRRLLWLARDEDFGTGDVTGYLLPAEVHASASFVAREPLTLCGAVFLCDTARAYDELIETKILAPEGRRLTAGEEFAHWQGPAWAILAAERVALNFLQRLSGIATLTREYVKAIAGTKTRVYDTRKTTPGWRELEKYAVRIGGGTNHRRGLYDAVLIKDNHLAALAEAGADNALEAIRPKLQQLREQIPADGFIQIEVDTLEQLKMALSLPIDLILLDNMSPEQLRKAVDMRNQMGLAGKIELEASGAITLETIHEVAKTQVERISIGAITHSARAVDIALDINIKGPPKTYEGGEGI